MGWGNGGVGRGTYLIYSRLDGVRNHQAHRPNPASLIKSPQLLLNQVRFSHGTWPCCLHKVATGRGQFWMGINVLLTRRASCRPHPVRTSLLLMDQCENGSEPRQYRQEGPEHAASDPTKFVASDLGIAVNLSSPISEQFVDGSSFETIRVIAAVLN